MAFNARTFASLVRSAAKLLGGTGSPPARTTRRTPSPSPAPRAVPARIPRPAATGPAGDYTGPVDPVYSPKPDGDPDPGEVVWAWVPYEDDYSQGKDRPVLLIGRSGSRLLALMMTSRDRNNGADSDPDYVDVGTGSWDAQGRPSEVKLDRVLQLDPKDIRRQGAVLPRAAFDRVARGLAAVR